MTQEQYKQEIQEQLVQLELEKKLWTYKFIEENKEYVEKMEKLLEKLNKQNKTN